MDLYTLFYLIFIIAPLSILIHELGHVSGALAVKADHIQLSIGTGTAQWTWTFCLNHVQITVYPCFFVGGFTQSDRKVDYNKPELILMTVLGPVFNGITACICYIINEMNPSVFLQLFFLFNCWMAISNSIPFQIGGRATDGYTILKLITRKDFVKK